MSHGFDLVHHLRHLGHHPSCLFFLEHLHHSSSFQKGLSTISSPFPLLVVPLFAPSLSRATLHLLHGRFAIILITGILTQRYIVIIVACPLIHPHIPFPIPLPVSHPQRRPPSPLLIPSSSSAPRDTAPSASPPSHYPPASPLPHPACLSLRSGSRAHGATRP